MSQAIATYRWRNKVFTMFENVEEYLKFIQALRTGADKIRQIIESLKKIPMNRSEIEREVSTLKYQISKYSLFQSDCSWVEADNELAVFIEELEKCYNELMMKYTYTIGDVIYFHNCLMEVLEGIDCKLAEYSH